MISLRILGCHSGAPRVNAHATSQYLQINNHHFLVDCGEGTQIQMRKYKVPFSKLSRIFISHLHGDHFFGLIGLISTLGLLGREKELHIHGPKGIKQLIEIQLKITESYIKYKLHFHELSSNESELIYEDEKVEVYTIPLTHRVYTNGYLFKEKAKARKLHIGNIKLYDEIEICDYHNLKAGKDYTLQNGEIISNEELTIAPPKPKSYAFCSDTIYKPDIVAIIKNVDLLYHEATFLEDRKELTERTKHSTAIEAGKIAKQAEVNSLVIGHFSGRYNDLEEFKTEAQTVFENCEIAEAGKIFEIKDIE